jgi:hypothetical protein
MGAAVRAALGILLVLAILDARAPEREYVPMVPPEPSAAAAPGGLAAGWYVVDRVVDGDALALRSVEGEVGLAGVAAVDGRDECRPDGEPALARMLRPGDPVLAEPAEETMTPAGGRHWAYLRVPRGDELWTLQELLLQRGEAALVRAGPLATRRYFGAFAAAERVGRQSQAAAGCSAAG